MKKKFIKKSIFYHKYPTPGKINANIKKSKKIKDLILSYTPGVGYISQNIINNNNNINKLTTKKNLIAIITNGSAVLGLGDIGTTASKPVMEGKAMLFKKLANINAYNIEINTQNTDEFINIVNKISNTFSAINLEDIKSPECFIIENKLKKILNIPVFHDDQHGTAIVITAALINALEIQKKNIKTIKTICFGAGAAAIATIKLLKIIGLNIENLYMFDSKGLINNNRNDVNIYKKQFSRNTHLNITINEAIKDCDLFIGLSNVNKYILNEEMLNYMSKNAIIFALSNPIPEINPKLVKLIRKDIIIATGRSDNNNQINNIICYPYIFKGILISNKKIITNNIKISVVNAIKNLSKEKIPNYIKIQYKLNKNIKYGKDYIIPKPTDYRLLQTIINAIKNTK